MNYLTRTDLNKKVYGIEQYIPGDTSMQEIGFGVTSGTTGNEVAVVIRTGKETNREYLKQHPKAKAYLRVSAKNISYINSANFFLRYGDIRRLLFLDMKDVNQSFTPKLIEEFKPSDIYSTPSLFNYFIDILTKLNKSGVLSNVKKFMFGGEFMPQRLYEKIKNINPHIEIQSEYSTAEANYVGFGCHYLNEKYKNSAFRVLHPLEGTKQAVSIINKDKENIGEIVLSTNELSRYKTGDLGEITNEECVCGSKKTLTLRGRRDHDIAHCVGATFLRSEIEYAFDKVEEYFKDYQVEVREVNDNLQTRGQVTFKIAPNNRLEEELKKGEGILHKIIDIVTKNLFITKTRNLAQLIDEGIFLYPSIEFVDPQPSTKKKIRLKRVYE